MSGLLDTRTDISYIAGKDWSSFWLTHLTSSSLVGIGSMPSVAKSSQILTWSDEKGHKAPFVHMWLLHNLFLYEGGIYYLRWECFYIAQMKRLLIKCCKWGIILIRRLVKISRQVFRHSRWFPTRIERVWDIQIDPRCCCSCCRPYYLEIWWSSMDGAMAFNSQKVTGSWGFSYGTTGSRPYRTF